MDGVYFGQGRVINEGFFDLAGLEVLKGPQSLFYGKNATAGVISINTANPTSTFQARTRVPYEFNAKKPSVEGLVSGPVTDTLALRLAGRWSKMLCVLAQDAAGTHSSPTNHAAPGFLNPTPAPPAPPRG